MSCLVLRCTSDRRNDMTYRAKADARIKGRGKVKWSVRVQGGKGANGALGASRERGVGPKVTKSQR